MGLDMYAMVTRETPAAVVDFEVSDARKIHTWRKHPNLHGWMEALYFEKGGKAEIFNCVPVALNAYDLDKLEKALLAGTLPETDGFFFGESDGSELDDDLDFLNKASRAIAEGYTVFYNSWW